MTFASFFNLKYENDDTKHVNIKYIIKTRCVHTYPKINYTETYCNSARYFTGIRSMEYYTYKNKSSVLPMLHVFSRRNYKDRIQT